MIFSNRIVSLGMITRLFILMLFLASCSLSLSAQDYSSSSLNPFAGSGANACMPITAYPAHIETSQYIVKICAYPEQDYQNIEFRNLRAIPPKRHIDAQTGEVRIEGAKSYSTSYQEPVSEHSDIRFTPCSDGVIISYIYDTPTSSGDYVSHVYLGRASEQPLKRPGSVALRPDLAEQKCK